MPSPCANASKITLLLLVVDADAGVADGEGHARTAARTSDSHLSGSSPLSATPIWTCTVAVLGELERVGEQVLEDLAEPLRVGDDGVSGQSGAMVDRVAERPCPGRPVRTRGASATRSSSIETSAISSVTVPDSTLARSRMLLRSSSSSLPGRMDDARVLDLRVGHVVVGVVLELLGEDQEAVQRCAQLVATCWR